MTRLLNSEIKYYQRHQHQFIFYTHPPTLALYCSGWQPLQTNHRELQLHQRPHSLVFSQLHQRHIYPSQAPASSPAHRLMHASSPASVNGRLLNRSVKSPFSLLCVCARRLRYTAGSYLHPTNLQFAVHFPICYDTSIWICWQLSARRAQEVAVEISSGPTFRHLPIVRIT